MAGPNSRNHPSKALSAKKSGTSLAQLTFPAKSDNLNMGTLFKFVKFQTSFGSGGTGVISKSLTNAHIALPLPENLQDTLNLNYDTVDLGAVGVGLKSGEAVGEALKDTGVGAAVSTFGDRFAGDAEYLARTLSQISGSVAGAINIASGNVPNPFTTAIFKSVELRRHNLNFRLTPESPEDSAAINTIINEFKKHALPKREKEVFLTMPDQVEIQFFGTNALYGFARCVIQGITVNYNPSNTPAFFKNSGGLIGAPQSVEIQLQLSEIEQLVGDLFGAPVTEAGPASPVGDESLPTAEQPGNKIRGDGKTPTRRLLGREI
ncbi:hypothetical protein OAU13_01000 [bacterium]|nr:hypothetical protein [bacterium]